MQPDFHDTGNQFKWPSGFLVSFSYKNVFKLGCISNLNGKSTNEQE